MKRSAAIPPLTVAVLSGAFASAAVPAWAGTSTAGADAEQLRYRPTFVAATFQAANSGANAVTYDPTLVPLGARAAVISASTSHGSRTWLLVDGLAPGYEYGAHVHVNRCGADPAAAGPHIQWVADPVKPSVDPAYANSRNEVWLDLTTNHRGYGGATSLVSWPIAEKQARSVVIHEHHTHTGAGEAGTAGRRLACVNVDFAQEPRPVPQHVDAEPASALPE